jgi:hypothetical protein
MLNLVVFTTLLLFISLALAIVSVISNEWFFISVKSDCKRWDCLNTEYYQNAIRYGLWFACPFGSGSDAAALAWASVDNAKKQCFYFSTVSPAAESTRQTPNVLAKRLRNGNLLDVEPYQVSQIRILFVIGTACLFITTIWSSVLLIYLCRFASGKSLEASMLHAVALFMLLFVDLATRIVAFVLFTVNSGNYLDYLFRTSYTVQTNRNHFTAEFNVLFDELLANYRITRQW